MYDWFVSPLRCPVCGALSPPTSVTNMQTHLRDDADGSDLAVGYHLDPLDLRRDDILNSGYLLIADPVPEEPIRLLEVWTCPECGHADNWALITIQSDEITGIEAVHLDRATFDHAHYISEQCFMLAAQISDVPAIDLSMGKVSCVEVLQQWLP